MGHNGLLVGQSGGPTPVINASLAGVIIEAQQQDTITHVYGMRDGFLGALHENLIDLTHLSQERLNLVTHTPASALGASQRAVTLDDCERIVQVMRAHQIQSFVCIGGSASMEACLQIERAAREQNYGLKVIGVPKTIDNDLRCTDHAPGYGSAARSLALAVRDAARALEASSSFEDVALFEVMGRTGWLAAATTLGRDTPDDAPHLLYFPEHVFDDEVFLDDVQRQFNERGHVLVAVSDSILDARGVPVAVRAGRLDVASYLTERVHETLGLRVRGVRLSSLQGASTLGTSSIDLAEATLVGREAVRRAVEGISGQMITLVRERGPRYICRTGLAPLERVAGVMRPLPDDFIAPEKTDVTAAFRAYAEPLIGGPLPPHARLGGKPVSPHLPVY